MTHRKTFCYLAALLMGMLSAFEAIPIAQTASADAVSAKSWIGKAAEIEEYMRSAPIIKTEPLAVGVTRSQRAFFAPGGPVDSVAWKPIKPGMSRGFFESYKSEIAAYELDKALQLDMVPPKVERRIGNDVGAAIMWVKPAKSFTDLGGAPRPPADQMVSWTHQLVRAKMFHNLIGDVDPNLGNWLVDPAWNLILIDHSRALTGTNKLVHTMQHIDAGLWDRTKALDADALSTAVGQWLSKREINAIVERRTKMQAEIDKLVKAKGAANVFLR